MSHVDDTAVQAGRAAASAVVRPSVGRCGAGLLREAPAGAHGRYYEFHGRKDPATLGAAELSAFLSSLATERKVAAPTQNQALAVLLFLYRFVLGQDGSGLRSSSAAASASKTSTSRAARSSSAAARATRTA